jgi:hypothetical protein
MGARILVAGIIGGIVLFAWGAVSHMLLPLGEMGVKSLPGEEVVVPVLKSAITEPGFYVFPGMQKEMTEAQMQEWEARLNAGPTGILVYQTEGSELLSPPQLLTEAGSNILAAILAAIIAAQIAGGYMARLVAVTLIGAIGWLSISASYWNWYGFPTEYSAAELVGEVAGWFLVAIPVAAIARPAARVVTTA